jgi:Kef-type K+ transport system membrane component KefB
VIEHSASGLETALALLVGAVVLVPLSLRFKIGSVLGYLAAGSLIGPWGLGLITDIASIRHLAEFGVVFLLFVIGIEMKPSRLWLMRRQVFGLGGLQVGLSGLALAGILLVAVPSLVGGVEHALLVGLGLALSSTAMGLQVLSERRELNAPHGRLAFAIL